MSQTVAVNMEALKWPIAPDGYIPNSVIRSWRRKDNGFNTVDCWHDVILHSLHQLDEDDQTDESTRIFWFIQDEEEEEGEVKRKKKENDTNKKDKRVKMEMEKKERADQKKKCEEDQMDRVVLMKESYNPQTSLQSHLKTSDEEKLNVQPQRKEVGSTHCSSLSSSSQQNKPKQLTVLMEDKKLHEVITPPLQNLSVPKKQRTSSFVSKEWPVSPVEHPVVSADTIRPKQVWLEPAVEPPVVSADTVISKQEPRTTIEPKNVRPQPLRPPSPNAVDHQLQRDLELPECPPVLSSTEYNDQSQMPLDWKVLQLFKKLKHGNKNLSHLRKLSTTAQHSPASKVVHPTAPTNTGGLNLYGGLDNTPAFNILQSTTQTPVKDSVSEWRKNLYKLISLEGFRSPRAARLASTENLVKSSETTQFVATMPSLQPGQTAAHQRVVQKIHMTDTVKPPSFQFHQVIPMASQSNFYTLNPRGKTQYGRLEFDWMRGSEDTLSKVSAVKTADTAHNL